MAYYQVAKVVSTQHIGVVMEAEGLLCHPRLLSGARVSDRGFWVEQARIAEDSAPSPVREYRRGGRVYFPGLDRGQRGKA